MQNDISRCRVSVILETVKACGPLVCMTNVYQKAMNGVVASTLTQHLMTFL